MIPHCFTRRQPGPNDVHIQVAHCGERLLHPASSPMHSSCMCSDCPSQFTNQDKCLTSAHTCAAGVCHSDLHQVFDEWKNTMFPVVPGHEITGIITAVGEEVTKFKVGERAGVGAYFHLALFRFVGALLRLCRLAICNLFDPRHLATLGIVCRAPKRFQNSYVFPSQYYRRASMSDGALRLIRMSALRARRKTVCASRAAGCMVNSCRSCSACKAQSEQFCTGPCTFTYNSPDPLEDGAVTKVPKHP